MRIRRKLNSAANASHVTLSSGPSWRVIQCAGNRTRKIACTFTYVNGALTGFVTVLIPATIAKTAVLHTPLMSTSIEKVATLIGELIEKQGTIGRFYSLDEPDVLVEVKP